MTGTEWKLPRSVFKTANNTEPMFTQIEDLPPLVVILPGSGLPGGSLGEDLMHHSCDSCDQIEIRSFVSLLKLLRVSPCLEGSRHS